MVCHSDRKYLQQGLLLAIINFLSLIDGDSYYYIHQKNLDVYTILAVLAVLEILCLPCISIEGTVLCHLCIVLPYFF